MDCPLARLSINDLPPAVLARVFTLTHPRRDGLALLLTCRHWLAVAEAECPQHLWGVVTVHSDSEQLLLQQAQAALLTMLRRQAACLTELRVVPRQGIFPLLRLGQLWPTLLQTLHRTPQLRTLHFFAAMYAPDPFVSVCQALGSLTSLRELEVDVHAQGTPLSALCPLSTLTRLVRLRLDLAPAIGELPPDLLPALGSLTRLHLTLMKKPSVAWQRPDGSGPVLRDLRLVGCRVGLPPDRLLPALRQLERLQVIIQPLEEEQWNVLPQLPRLTFLLLHRVRVPWHAVLRCAGLRELAFGHPDFLPPVNLPPGSLLQLTRLSIPCVHVRPAWLALPQLRSLELTYGEQRGVFVPSLAQCLQLEDLLVQGRALQEVTRAASSLTRLTRLAVVAGAESGGLEGLEEGPYLAMLRQFVHCTPVLLRPGAPTPTWHLPASLAAATSLELLVLGRDRNLRLRGEEDAALLRALPRLRHVVLPLGGEGGVEAAAAVERIREALREGTGAGAGPPHAVEVVGVKPPDRPEIFM